MIAAHAITFKTLKNNLAGRSHYVDFNLTVIGLRRQCGTASSLLPSPDEVCGFLHRVNQPREGIHNSNYEY